MLNQYAAFARMVGDPQIRVNKSTQKEFVIFSIAVNNHDYSKETLFLDCIIESYYSYQIGYAKKWCNKGDAVIVVGELRPNNYYDKDGRPVNKIQLAVEKIRKFQNAPNNQQNKPMQDNESTWIGGTEEETLSGDALPF